MSKGNVINFNKNTKKYIINGDESKAIYIDTSDVGIVSRAKKSFNIFNDLQKELETCDKNDIFDVADKLDVKIREQINYIFGSDVCTPAFGLTNCCSLSDGRPLFLNFLDALLPAVEADIRATQNKSLKGINKYTSKVKK